MSPDDPRHGTNGGYLEHAATDKDYCQPCRDAHAKARRELWRKRYRLRADRLYIDATGTRRRIRALQALGWRFVDIDKACGRTAVEAGHTWSHNLVRQEKVHINSARTIAAAYDRLCMTLATSPLAGRTRTMAAKKGWLPPLAWNDIDDPNETPHVGSDHRHKTDVDPVVVQRVIGGDKLPMTTAERFAVVAQMRDTGWSFLRIEAQTGITKPERLVTREAVA